MDAAFDVLHGVNVLAGAVLIGALVTERLLILPLVRSLPPDRGQAVLQTLSPRAWRAFPVFGGLMTASAFAVLGLALVESELDEPANVVMLVATLATGIAFLSNVGLYLRADRGARALAADRVVDEFPRSLERLSTFNDLRLALFAFAYVLFVVAAVTA